MAAHPIGAIESELKKPLPVDPGNPVAGYRKRIGLWQLAVVDNPAPGGQMPEVVIAADRGNRGDKKEDEEKQSQGRMA